jgi:hypothetical protein
MKKFNLFSYRSLNTTKWINYLLIVIAIPLYAFCCDKCPDRYIIPCTSINTPFTWDTIFTNNLNNQYESVMLSSNDSVPKKAYGIRLNFKITPYAGTVSSDSCAYLVPSDTIIDIKILTIYDFDAIHLANSDVSDYFEIASPASGNQSYNTGYSYISFSSIKDYLAETTDQSQFHQLDFLLTTSPQLNTKNEFKIVIEKKHSTLIVTYPSDQVHISHDINSI